MYGWGFRILRVLVPTGFSLRSFLIANIRLAVLQGKTTLDLNADHDTLTNSNDAESDCISDRNAALEEQRVREQIIIY